MHSRTRTLDTLLQDGFILVFNQPKLDIVKTAESLLAAGIRNMEVTCRIPQPLDAMRRLRDAMPDFTIGAASLVDSPAFIDRHAQVSPTDPLPSIDQVVDAGVNYLVSAGAFQPDTYSRFGDDLIFMPGCGTVSEIVTQFSLGADLVKVFPAKQLGGVAFVKGVDAPLHKIVPLVPTGGTNADNIPDYIAAGVLVVGGSFSALDPAAMAQAFEGDYDGLTQEFARLKSIVNTHRTETHPEVDWTTATASQISSATGRCFNT
jgi:2-dehydro-3-deoxyphosphogluconate aldolase / (4S)-4-hydroxy-2-oxoglutarate aldolase